MKKCIAAGQQSRKEPRRILQVSLDIEVPANTDGYQLSSYVADIIEANSSMIVRGAGYQADMTRTYVQDYHFEDSDDASYYEY